MHNSNSGKESGLKKNKLIILLLCFLESDELLSDLDLFRLLFEFDEERLRFFVSLVKCQRRLIKEEIK